MHSTLEEILADSKLAGAAFRGLPKSTVDDAKKDGKFHYINALERPYKTSPCNVNSVMFDISRNGDVVSILTFDVPKSEKDAIVAIEDYLSKPLTKTYFEKIKHDMFDTDLTWKEAKESYPKRGDCLTDAVFLESVTIGKDGSMSMFIGS